MNGSASQSLSYETTPNGGQLRADVTNGAAPEIPLQLNLRQVTPLLERRPPRLDSAQGLSGRGAAPQRAMPDPCSQGRAGRGKNDRVPRDS